MTYGIKLRNKNKEIQIDELYSNYVYTEGGDTVTNGGNIITLSTPTNRPPVVLIRPDTTGIKCWVHSFTYSSNKFTQVILGTIGKTHYRVFLHKDDLPETNEPYGIKIRNSKGETIYNSGHRPFKIRQKIDVSVPRESFNTTSSQSHSNYIYPWYLMTPPITGFQGFSSIPPEPPVSFLSWFRIALQIDSSSSFILSWGQVGFSAWPGGATDFIVQNSTETIYICEIDSIIQNNP